MLGLFELADSTVGIFTILQYLYRGQLYGTFGNLSLFHAPMYTTFSGMQLKVPHLVASKVIASMFYRDTGDACRLFSMHRLSASEHGP